MPPRFILMLGQDANGNWRSLCDHGTRVYALWGAINTRKDRQQ